MCIVYAFHEQRSRQQQYNSFGQFTKEKKIVRMVAAMHIRVRDPDHLYSEYLHFT